MADFDKKAPEYDEWYQTSKGNLVDALETECAFSLYKPKPGEQVLDAGCGTGNFSLKLAHMGATVEGVDLSSEMIERAKEKAERTNFPERLHFQIGDLERLAFPNHYFDAVFSMAAFEFIHNDQKVLNEMMRVVKPGGFVMVGTITRNSSWGREYMTHMPREDSVFHHASFKTREEMQSLNQACLKKTKECVFFPFSTAEDQVSRKLDAYYRQKGAVGAFVCLLWQKPL